MGEKVPFKHAEISGLTTCVFDFAGHLGCQPKSGKMCHHVCMSAHHVISAILCWYLLGVSSSELIRPKPCFNCFFWSRQSSMGFLKRIFSFGSRKKRSPAPQTSTPSIDNEQRRKLEEEHEAAVGRILRSSSSRYAIVKETDYSNLPPLRKPLCYVIGSHTESSSPAHPINDVLAGCNTTPKEGTSSLRLSPSVSSLASSTLSRQSTFSVTVHDRQRHAATEFPNANPELGDDTNTPTQRSKRHSHQLGLRSDPSVVSLISLYDEHGRLPAETFSNSPPSAEKQERPQKKRGGSTLRELLGGSDSLESKSGGHLESDISWAEQYLR